jgi:uncharacterized protein YjiS (DUF1127 family)
MTVSSGNFQLKGILDDLQTRFSRVLASVKAAKRRRARYRATLSELAALSDRELADLAIPRAHIRRRALEELQKEADN